MAKTAIIIVLLGLIIVFCGCGKKDQINSKAVNINGIPAWIEDFINAKKDTEPENPPASIRECTYNNETVYYVPAPCCDMFDTLYNWDKEKICSPSGGQTGQGDGKCKDFSLDKSSCQIIWQDDREPFSNNNNINQ